MYVALENIWSIVWRVVCYSEMKEVITSYIQNSPSNLEFDELTMEEFEKAKANDWYID